MAVILFLGRDDACVNPESRGSTVVVCGVYNYTTEGVWGEGGGRGRENGRKNGTRPQSIGFGPGNSELSTLIFVSVLKNRNISKLIEDLLLITESTMIITQQHTCSRRPTFAVRSPTVMTPCASAFCRSVARHHERCSSSLQPHAEGARLLRGTRFKFNNVTCLSPIQVVP
jgi:hypothetical protein